MTYFLIINDSYSQGQVLYLSTSTSFIASWEAVGTFSSGATCQINAQIELFPTGIIEMRYGALACPSTPTPMYTGIMDAVQGFYIPSPFTPYGAAGLLSAGSRYFSTSGVRYGMSFR